MKKAIIISLLFVLFAAIFSACKKDDAAEIPINPDEAVMSFSFAEANMPMLGVMIKATPTELEKIFIDLGDGNFVPAAENGLYDETKYFAFNKPTKGKNVRIKGKTTDLLFYFGNLVALDVSQNILLETIKTQNQISTFTALDLSKNVNLKVLEIQSSNLTSLNLSKNTNLTKLEVAKSPLNTLVFAADNQIETMWLIENQLSQIDLSQCKKLKDLVVINSSLNTIDISKSTMLERVQIFKTNIAQLNVSANQNLMLLRILENKITSLVLPASFPKLTRFECQSNRLNNTQMDALANAISTSAALGNNILFFTCIDKKNPAEQNVISVAVVNKIKAKGWKVYDANGSYQIGNWLEYAGN